MTLVFLIISMVVFLGVAVFGENMTDPNEIIRWLAGGLAFFAAAHLPLPSWPNR